MALWRRLPVEVMLSFWVTCGVTLRARSWTVLKTSQIGVDSDSLGLDESGDESMRGQAGFFDVDDRLKRLSDLGDRLEGFRSAVDFEMFRGDLDQALTYSDGARGGRPPFDPVMMFKILVIQATNNLP